MDQDGHFLPFFIVFVVPSRETIFLAAGLCR